MGSLCLDFTQIICEVSFADIHLSSSTQKFTLFGKFLFSLVPTLALFLGLVEYAARGIGFRLTWVVLCL